MSRHPFSLGQTINFLSALGVVEIAVLTIFNFGGKQLMRSAIAASSFWVLTAFYEFVNEALR
jgi:hypothetical protein